VPFADDSVGREGPSSCPSDFESRHVEVQKPLLMGRACTATWYVLPSNPPGRETDRYRFRAPY